GGGADAGGGGDVAAGDLSGDEDGLYERPVGVVLVDEDAGGGAAGRATRTGGAVGRAAVADAIDQQVAGLDGGGRRGLRDDVEGERLLDAVGAVGRVDRERERLGLHDASWRRPGQMAGVVERQPRGRRAREAEAGRRTRNGDVEGVGLVVDERGVVQGGELE